MTYVPSTHTHARKGTRTDATSETHTHTHTHTHTPYTRRHLSFWIRDCITDYLRSSLLRYALSFVVCIYIYIYVYTYTYTHTHTHTWTGKHGTRTQHVSFVISSTFIHIISSLNDSATGLSKGSSRGSVDQVRYRQRVQARLTRASLALSPADRQKASPYSRSVKETVHAGGNTSASITRYRRAFFWIPTYTV